MKAIKGAEEQANTVVLTADVSPPDIAIWDFIHDLSRDQ
jgi:ribosomal protein L7Ae-like RNA K-turn-binding protein